MEGTREAICTGASQAGLTHVASPALFKLWTPPQLITNSVSGPDRSSQSADKLLGHRLMVEIVQKNDVSSLDFSWLNYI